MIPNDKGYFFVQFCLLQLIDASLPHCMHEHRPKNYAIPTEQRKQHQTKQIIKTLPNTKTYAIKTVFGPSSNLHWRRLTTMSSHSYKLLPALKNPIKFLKNVTTRHSTGLYLRGYYDGEKLQTNPFAEQLRLTRNDLSRSNFPIGNMIQVVVHSDDHGHWLIPVLEKPLGGQNPAKYVINWRTYIDFHMRKRFFPLPQKYLARSPSMISKVKVSPNFTEEVELLYKNRIKELLVGCENSEVNKDNQDGFFLEPNSSVSSDRGTCLKWESQTPIIETDLVERRMFFPYKDHAELAYFSVLLCNYKSVYK